ncbi:MAG TPA: hypothetical protein VLT33_39425 [Labilithrix sp.]|nr:hypothetical protein [Labilithrix sp.]
MTDLLRAAAIAALAVVLVGGGSVRAAHAQTREADAERLFREGQKLLEERRYGEACPKFEAAYKKDGALGTLLNLAFCHKEQGAIWYAWLEFREAESKATELNRPDRRDFAHARLTELEKGLPKVVIDNPRKVPLSDVLVEDRKVWEAERGAVFAAEGGQRKFTFRAKGKKPATILVNVARGDRPQRVTVPELETLTADDVPPPPPPPPPPPEPAKREVPPPAASESSTGPQRTIGWVAIGVGSGAAALGLVTGAITWFGPCGRKACTPDERSSSSTTAAISTVSLVAAGALVAGGLVLVLTAPSAGASASAQVSTERRVAAPRLVLTPILGPTFGGVSGTF